NTLGWPLPYNPGIGVVMTLHPLRLNFPIPGVGSGYPEVFTSETELAELTQQIGSETAALIDPAVFSTATWQAFFSQVDGCTLNHPPNAFLGYLGSTCYADALAFGLAIMNHYAVATTTKTALVNWGNAVWASSGHNFATDAAATCSYAGTIPQTLQCTNF